MDRVPVTIINTDKLKISRGDIAITTAIRVIYVTIGKCSR